jgi:O-antigen/teichoic acid export membrane protein
MGSAGRIGKSVGAYGVGLVVARLSSIAVLPVLARAVSPELLGTFATLSSAMLVAYVLLADLGLGEAAMRLAAEENDAGQVSLFKTVAVARAFLGGAVALLLVAFARPLSLVLTGSEAAAVYAPLLGASVLLGGIARALSDYLRFIERHRVVATSLGLLTVAENALVLALALATRLDLWGLLAARVAAQALGLAVLAVPSLSLRSGRLLPKAVVPLLGIGFPIGVFHLLVALRSVDRVVIARLSGLFDAGVYDVAARFAAPVALSNVALSMALEPLAYRLGRDADAEATLADFLRGYAAIFGALTFTIGALAPELLALFAPAYVAGALLVPALLFVDVAEGIQRVAGLPGELAKRTRLWLVSATANAVLSLGLMVLLVPRIGAVGAAVALLAGALAGASLATVLARRIHPIRLPVFRASAVVVVGALLGTWALGADVGRSRPLALRVAFAAAFAGLSWVLSGASHRSLRRRLRGLFRD